jgi:hypothetical protein
VVALREKRFEQHQRLVLVVVVMIESSR